MSDQGSTPTDFSNFVAGAVDPAFVAQLDATVGVVYSVTSGVQFELCSDEGRRQTALRVQAAICEVLQLSGFDRAVATIVRLSNKGLRFLIEDADFAFTVNISDYGLVEMTRTMSGLNDFHRWYSQILPSIAPLFLQICEIMGEEIVGFERRANDDDRRQYASKRPKFQIQNASYRYHVQIKTAPKKGDRDPALSRLVRQTPKSCGKLVGYSVVEEDDIHKRLSFEALRSDLKRGVTEGYQVSADSGSDAEYLFFVFTLKSGVASPQRFSRPEFKIEDFMTNSTSRESYLEFFRQKCLCGFVHDLLAR